MSPASARGSGRRGDLEELSVSASVGRQFFRDRLNSQYASHYHLIVSIFKGVALSGAGLSFLAILASQEATGVKATALAIWVTGLAAIIATYNGIMVVSIVVNTPPNVIDLVTPFVMGLAEFVQFGVLMPRAAPANGVEPGTAAQLQHLTWWPLVFAALMLSACVGISNSKVQMHRAVATAPAGIKPLLRWYVRSLTQSQMSTGVMSVVMTVGFLVFHYGAAGLRHWQAVLAAVGLFGMVNGIVATEQVRHRIAASVDPVAPRPPAVAEVASDRDTEAEPTVT